jgi:hypothetical protein
MIARISLVRRRPDISPADFVQHWLGPHAAIARQVPELRGLAIYSPDGAAPAICDGIGITWFNSVEEAEAGFASDRIQNLLEEDRPKFPAEVRSFFALEHILVPPPARN